LKGSAPTNNGPFVSGDYNRKTGLVGNGTTKFLNSNRNNNADPQNSKHNAVFISTLGTGPAVGITTPTTGIDSISSAATRNRNATPDFFTAVAGFCGTNRDNSSSYTRRNNNTNTTLTRSSETVGGGNILIFNYGTTGADHRISFYSIGEALDLALLDARVTTLINDIGVAIP
jgi:hypothetical protein